MAAAVDSPTVLQAILVAIIPVVLSPIVAWVLGRSKVSKEAATIDYLNKRLDFLERLNKLHTQLTEGPIRPFLDTEIDIAGRFCITRPRSFHRLRRWRRLRLNRVGLASFSPNPPSPCASAFSKGSSISSSE
jgi:hypothetical protein